VGYFGTWKANSAGGVVDHWEAYPVPAELTVQRVTHTECFDHLPATPQQSTCLAAFAGLIPLVWTTGNDQWVNWGVDQRYMYGARATHNTDNIAGTPASPAALQALRVYNGAAWVAHPAGLTLSNNSAAEWDIGPLALNSFLQWDRVP